MALFLYISKQKGIVFIVWKGDAMANWFIYNKKANYLKNLENKDITKLQALILANRDITNKETVEMFVDPNLEKLHDPFLLADMNKAVELIIETMKNGGEIRIFGDYDQDGIASVMTLLDGFLYFYDNLSYDIPHRVADGYGMSDGMVEKAIVDGVSLIITCDNGITGFDQVDSLKKAGIKVIVTDHHEIETSTDGEWQAQKLPEADAVINPKRIDSSYPFKDLCGAGVCFKLIQALYQKIGGDFEYLASLLEYVAMGTVCDIVSLTDENRIFVIEGLKRLNYTEKIGIKAILDEMNWHKPIDEYTLGFIIGPTMNATGRLASAKLAIELLMEEDIDRIYEIAKELVSLNVERKKLTEEGLDKCIEIIEKNNYKDNDIIVVYEPSINESICGIVAGRIKEKYYRPTIVLTNSLKENIAKGSGRSIESFDIHEACYQYKDNLESFGGHKMACGLSIDVSKIDDFRKFLNDNSQMSPKDKEKVINIDTAISIDKLSLEFAESLNNLKPFGKDFEKPIFADKAVIIESIAMIGKNKNTLKLSLRENDIIINAIKFNAIDTANYLVNKFGKNITGNKIDIVYYPDINEFRGNRTLQLRLVDIRWADMTSDFDKEYEIFEKLILENNPNADIALIKKAYYFGEVNHRGQKRNSGEDYFIHPIAVAKTISNMKLDDQTICAGLMHDVLEDTPITYDQMKEEFGEEITFLVEGVTKLKNLNYSSREEKQAENIRKMVMAMSNDVRVVLIKLADRLHNMRTLEYKTREKQIQTATETIEIYVPLAHRLGIYSIKWELEDLCFRYQEPEKYYELAEMVASKRREREAYINEIIETLTDSLKDSKINYEISGRPKSLYSIYKKMNRNNIVFEEIYDLTAVRVLVDTIAECYEVLGKVHSLWRPIPNRIKDYIGQPKPNGYRSLHTTVFGEDSKPFEVQIRTRQMHKECEYGVAAHWRYKENNKKETEFDSAMEFLRRIMEWQRDGAADIDSQQFMETLKTDFFSREIYVYSPAGEIYSLPLGSCTIDFAYKVHTEVGNKCIGAKVNGSIVPVAHKLKTGDVVEILTSKNSAGPSRDWLNIVKSSQAKSKIKQFFKRNDKEENIETGKNQIIRDIKKNRTGYKSLLKDEWIDEISSELGFPGEDEMYAAVGYGRITSEQVIQKLIKKEKESEKKETNINESLNINKGANPSKTFKGEVKVSDLEDDIEVKFAKCCTPVPGDPIIGFITMGNGISVHTKSCPNIINNRHPERLIDVYWQNDETDKFPVKIQLISNNSPSVIFDVSKILSALNVNIVGMNARVNDNNEGVIDLSVEVNSIDQLDDVMGKLKSISALYSVYRVNN